MTGGAGHRHLLSEERAEQNLSSLPAEWLQRKREGEGLGQSYQTVLAHKPRVTQCIFYSAPRPKEIPNSSICEVS